MVSLRPGMEKDRDEVLRQLIDIQYDRNEMDFKRGTFRVRGDVVEIIPANEAETAIRVEFFGDEIDRITQIDVLTGEILGSWSMRRFSLPPITWCRRSRSAERRTPLKKSWKSVWNILRAKTSFWKPRESRRDEFRCGDAPGDRLLFGIEIIPGICGASCRSDSPYADGLFRG